MADYKGNNGCGCLLAGVLVLLSVLFLVNEIIRISFSIHS